MRATSILNSLLSQRSPRLLALLLVGLLSLASAGATACSGDDGSGEDVDKVLNDTFDGEQKIKSGQLNMNLTADLKGPPQLEDPVRVKVGGPFESRGEREVPKLDLDFSVGAGGRDFTAGVVSTGDRGYINFQGTFYRLPPEIFRRFQRELARQARQGDNQPQLSALGVQPRDWLENPKEEGVEEVGGTETIHISSDVNVARMLDDIDELLQRAQRGGIGLSREQRQQLPSEIPASVKKQIQESVKEARLDVYTGKDDKLLRKLDLKLDFDVAENLRNETSGVTSGKIEFSVEIAELGEAQEIEEPKDAQSFEELQNLITGNLGGLGALQDGSGGGGSSGGGSGGSGGSSDGSGQGSGGDSGIGSGGGAQPDPEEAQRYLRCVQDAKGTEELRKCAELIR